MKFYLCLAHYLRGGGKFPEVGALSSPSCEKAALLQIMARLGFGSFFVMPNHVLRVHLFVAMLVSNLHVSDKEMDTLLDIEHSLGNSEPSNTRCLQDRRHSS